MATLTPAWASFLCGPNSAVAGTRDARLVPSCARVAAVRCVAGVDRLTFWLPTAAAARAIADLRANGLVALVSQQSLTHRTLQVKGRAVDVRSATDQDLGYVEAQVRALQDALEPLGLPRALTERFAWWPATAVEIAVDSVYDQTPGPGAGEHAVAG